MPKDVLGLLMEKLIFHMQTSYCTSIGIKKALDDLPNDHIC